MLADHLADNGFYGAQVLVLSSASSKTAYAAAFELHGKGPRVVGLTSPGNVEFTRGLGCYDEVLTYEEVSKLDTAQTDRLSRPFRPSRGTRRAARASRRAVSCTTSPSGSPRRSPTPPARRRCSSRRTRCASAPSTGAATAWTPASATPGADSRAVVEKLGRRLRRARPGGAARSLARSAGRPARPPHRPRDRLPVARLRTGSAARPASGSGSASSSGTRARTSSWKRRASSGRVGVVGGVDEHGRRAALAQPAARPCRPSAASPRPSAAVSSRPR